jgi:colanic acid/amylovoran biosynthesis glycosyltransferase
VVNRVKVRTAFLSTHYPHPAHTFIENEVIGLPLHGIEVVPFALNPPAPSHLITARHQSEHRRTRYLKGGSRKDALRKIAGVVARQPIGLTLLYIRLHREDLGYPRRLLKRTFQYAEALLLYAWCEELDVRHVHAHMGQATATVAWYTSEIGNRFDPGTWSWSMTIHGWHEFVAEADALLTEKLRSAAFVVAISDFTRAQLMRIGDACTWKKISVVRCGIDLERFHNRESGGRDGSIVCVARLSAEKGHAVLLEAVASLRSGGSDVPLVLIGDGPSRGVLEGMAERLGISDLVTFRGAQPPEVIAEQLRVSSVFCLPTFAEGLPVVLMEAMASGIPVVTTPIAGIPELVTEETGHLVPCGRADQLADVLARVIVEPVDAVRVDAAYHAVTSMHDVTTSVAKLSEVFVSALSSKHTA